MLIEKWGNGHLLSLAKESDEYGCEMSVWGFDRLFPVDLSQRGEKWGMCDFWGNEPRDVDCRKVD